MIEQFENNFATLVKGTWIEDQKALEKMQYKNNLILNLLSDKKLIHAFRLQLEAFAALDPNYSPGRFQLTLMTKTLGNLRNVLKTTEQTGTIPTMGFKEKLIGNLAGNSFNYKNALKAWMN